MKHTAECAKATEVVARIVSSVHGVVYKAEADRYQAAKDACPACKAEEADQLANWCAK